MHKLAIVSATCLLAACSGGPVEKTEEAVSVSEGMTTANGTPAGTYHVAAADGTASLVTLNADGSYSQMTPEGTYPGEGTFAVVDGKTCFKVRAVGAQPTCYSETERASDGSYTATPDGGEPLTVTPYQLAAGPTQ